MAFTLQLVFDPPHCLLKVFELFGNHLDRLVGQLKQRDLSHGPRWVCNESSLLQERKLAHQTPVLLECVQNKVFICSWHIDFNLTWLKDKQPFQLPSIFENNGALLVLNLFDFVVEKLCGVILKVLEVDNVL